MFYRIAAPAVTPIMKNQKFTQKYLKGNFLRHFFPFFTQQSSSNSSSLSSLSYFLGDYALASGDFNLLPDNSFFKDFCYNFFDPDP